LERNNKYQRHLNEKFKAIHRDSLKQPVCRQIFSEQQFHGLE